MKTGIFDMPFADYQAARGVSQSRLKLMSRSPAHMKYAIEHPEPSTPDQIIGTVFDTAIFEPENLEDCCHVRPSHYPGEKGAQKPWHGGATWCKEWVSAHKDKPVVPQDDFTAICLMRDQIFKHPAAAEALKKGKGASLFCEDAETGLQLKARPDWLSGNSIVDLKSCQDASPDGFARTVAQFGYSLQAALYLDVAATLGLGKEHFLFICCEKERPYAVACYELDEESIGIGRSKYRRLLNRYLECVVEDKWPGYSRHVETISLPKWAKASEWNAILLDDRPVQPALEIA